MMIRPQVTLTAFAAGLLSLAGVASADTLVMRDGRRVEGTLVGVRGDTIEFERGGFGRRTERYDRSDVRRIELDDHSLSRDDDYGRNERNDRHGRDDDRGGSYGRPSGMRERTISVSASSGWTDTGIELRAGQRVYFQSAGRIRWGKDRRDDAGGEHNSPRNPGRPMPDRPGAALIGRVDSDDPFFIGNEDGPIRVRSTGRLKLGVNDDYLLDNSGDFRVTVYY
jgi:hypothetical protein